MPVIDLVVNGERRRLDADPQRSLLAVLREDLDLTGSKYGCGEGQCGACTVLVDGNPTRSCTIPIAGVANSRIATIEGLEQHGVLTPVQQAFLDEGAFQCGYCTSGMIMSATALLRDKHHPTDDQILAYMNTNVCRCGTYPRILAAIKRAAQQTVTGGAK